jgi:uncharacterized membrane protein YhaH (DUF805 family)
MSDSDLRQYLTYAIWGCLALGVVNLALVFRRSRSWALPAACMLMALTLFLYLKGASPAVWVIGALAVFVSLGLDMILRVPHEKKKDGTES